MPVRLSRFDLDPQRMAHCLLGQRLVRIVDGTRLAGKIVEVEAYLGGADRASHTYGGRRSTRNETMWWTGGHAYVYFTYGMHYCFNVVCGRAGEGVAVLVRAIEPLEGLDSMFRNRPMARCEYDLCSGPAKICQALRIDGKANGENLVTSESLFIEELQTRPLPEAAIVRTPRIGVAYAGDWANQPLRLHVRDNLHVSSTRRRNRGISKDGPGKSCRSRAVSR